MSFTTSITLHDGVELDFTEDEMSVRLAGRRRPIAWLTVDEGEQFSVSITTYLSDLSTTDDYLGAPAVAHVNWLNRMAALLDEAGVEWSYETDYEDVIDAEPMLALAA